MPTPRSTKLRLLTVACTALTFACIALWGVSIWYYAGRFDSDGQNSTIAGMLLIDGTFTIFWQDSRYTADTLWVSSWFWQPSQPTVHWVPEFEWGQVHRWVSIPLWIPVALSLLATIAARHAERRSRRPARAALCPTCRYDLAATTTGTPCPECGTPTPAAPPTPPA